MTQEEAMLAAIIAAVLANNRPELERLGRDPVILETVKPPCERMK